MATKKKEEQYIPQAIPSKINAVSRMSIKVKDTFYTLEYSEERVIPTIEGIDIVQERKALWDTVNEEVDAQVQSVYDLYAK